MQKFVAETEEAQALVLLLERSSDPEWVDAVAVFLRKNLIPTIPDDGKLYSVRISWTIGGA